MFCLSKYAYTRGRDIHDHNTRHREQLKDWEEQNTNVWVHLPSEAGVVFSNRPKVFKTCLKGFLASKAFYKAYNLFVTNFNLVGNWHQDCVWG